MAKAGYLTVTFTHDGKRHYVYAKTPEELQQKLEAAKRESEPEIPDTFRKFSASYLATYKCDISDNYRAQMNRWIKTCNNDFGDIPLEQITTLHIAKLLHGCSPSVAPKVYRLLHSIFTDAYDNGYIKRNPCTSRLRPVYKGAKRHSLTPEESAFLIGSIKDQTLLQFTVLALHTGMRRGELLGLMWSDISFTDKEINVQHNLTHRGNTPVVNDYLKTEAGRRRIPLDHVAIETLMAIPMKGQYVFTGVNPMTKGKMETMLSKLAPYTAHQLRHTAITNWFDFGLDIKEISYIAGHANSQTTLDIYTEYLVEKRFEETKAKVANLRKEVV